MSSFVRYLIARPFYRRGLLSSLLRPDWLTPIIQRQSTVPATSISFGQRRRGWHLDADYLFVPACFVVQ